MKVWAVSVVGAGRVEVIERPGRQPLESDRVLIAPLAVGLCGTDLELINGTMVYLRTGLAKLPRTPGHEWVGAVVEVGSGVAGFSVGDVVVGECSIGCGVCERCRKGAYHLCDDRQETGLVGLDGALASRMVAPARSLHRVPSGVALEDASLVEPSAVAFRALTRLQVRAGDRVLVVGVGTIGWLCVALLVRWFHVEVYILEPDCWKVERAMEAGGMVAEEDYAFESVVIASGSPQAIGEGQRRLAPGGRMVLVGLSGAESTAVNTDAIVVGDQTVIGSLGSPGVWEMVLKVLAEGAFQPSSIVTHRFGLQDFHSAISLLSNPNGRVGKILVIPG